MIVLHVEDYAIEAQLVRDSLAWRAPELRIEMAVSVAQACDRLMTWEATRGNAAARAADDSVPQYDLVLTDLRLPDGSGLDILKFVRERDLPLAVVVLTGSGDERSVFEALHAGADDYIAKDGDYLQTLPRTLKLALERFRADTVRRVQQLRVLYAEPSDIDIDLTRRSLARSAPHIVLEAVHGPDDVLRRFIPGGIATLPDVLLLDYRLPGLSALDLVKELRQRQGLDIPVVLVTGQGAEHVARLAVKLGVSDYLLKAPGYLDRLPASLDGAYHRAASARERRALVKSERELHSLADNLPDVVMRFDRQLRLVYANSAALRAAGLESEPINGGFRLAETGFGADVVTALETALQVVFRTGRLSGLAFTLSGHNKPERHYDCRFVIERKAAGQAETLLAIARDVTEARQAEAQVQASERLARAAIDALTAQIAILDDEGTVLTVNSAWRSFAIENSAADDFVFEGSNYLEVCTDV